MNTTVLSDLSSLACHGATCGLFLMAAALAWRDRRQTGVGRLLAALLFSAAAGSINSVPGFAQAGAFWRAPVLALATGVPALFWWLWARAVFDDDFVLRGSACGTVGCARKWAVLVSAYGSTLLPRLAPAVDLPLQFLAFGLALLAATRTNGDVAWRPG